MKIETFDLLEFENANSHDKKLYAKKIDNHLQKIGFLIIINHGISKTCLNNISLVLDIFFNQNENFKKRFQAPYNGYPYGYFVSESETLAKSIGNNTPPDLKESFNGGPIRVPSKNISKEAFDFCYLPTIWPEIENFKKYWEIYYNEMENLAKRLMSVFAISLNLKANYFNKYINNPISALRALNYPKITKKVLPNQQRAGEHTDYGSLTILNSLNSIDGLQVKYEYDWIDVPDIENSFIINIGDLMARWTNDRWSSTLHRVVPKNYSGSRKTLAFFHQPDWDAKINCISSCIDKGIKYSEVKSGPYLMNKFNSTTNKNC